MYPSLIYVISLHRAGQLTWPALIIHIFIILLGLANLIAQFLLWKLPFSLWLSQVVLWYLAIALSNTVTHENEQSSIWSSWEKLHLWNKFNTHLSGTWWETCLAPLKTEFYEKWSGSDFSEVILLFLLNVHQRLMKLKYFNFLQHTSQNTQLSVSGHRTPLSFKGAVLTFTNKHAFTVLFNDCSKCSFVAVIFLFCLENEEIIVFPGDFF